MITYFRHTRQVLAIEVIKQISAELRSLGFHGPLIFDYDGSSDDGCVVATHELSLQDQAILSEAGYAVGWGEWFGQDSTSKNILIDFASAKKHLLSVVWCLLPAGWEISSDSYYGTSGQITIDPASNNIRIEGMKHLYDEQDDLILKSTEYSEDY